MTDIIFSNSQISRIFEEIANNNDEKIILDLGDSNLSSIPLELLEAVVEKLKPNSFANKLQDRIKQLQDEHVERLSSQLNEVDSEHKMVSEENRRLPQAINNSQTP